jgi:2-C-methyl-D-erythritol 4-phosphate cytidylyltransferase
VTGTSTVAVVLAGGAGLRMGVGRPKQLLELSGRTLLERAVSAFEDNELIDRIVVMASEETVAVVGEIVERAAFTKVTDLAVGGASRRSTTWAALERLDDDVRNVLIHDAARPFVSGALITRCVEALGTHEAAVPVLPSSDTIYQVTADDRLDVVLPRATLRRAQTPQAFELSLLRRAHALAAADDHREATDDCGLVHHYFPDIEVHMVEGEETNIKVTTPSDLALAAVLASDANR